MEKLIFIAIITLFFQATLITGDPCYLYPKIFGGSSGNSRILSVDANSVKDILAAGGETADSNIVGTTLSGPAPTISVYSISTTQIYWMKTDVSKSPGSTFHLSLSPNGNYLIAMIIQFSLSR